MSTLRILLAAAPSPSFDAPWALYDAQERRSRSGVGNPSTWPTADRREVVLAASAVRLAGIALPPMPEDRVAAAAAFALEDQLAGPAQEQHLAVSTRGRDGIVEVAIASRAPFSALQKDFVRVVAEPAIAPRPAAGIWRWYRSGLDGGFVRKPDGAAFAVSAPSNDGAVPAELTLALAHAMRTTTGAPRVEVAFPAEDAQLDGWSTQCGAQFKRSVAWHWDDDGSAIAAATNLLQLEFSRTPRQASRSVGSRLRWAAGLAIAALALHVGATIAQWTWLRVEAWQTARAIVATARDAGAGDAADADTAATLLTRKFTDARHRAGLPSPTDALPLLARAASALAALPPGTFKSAKYTPGSWTIELAKLDPLIAASLDHQLTIAGLATLQATTATGTRMRATLAPGLDRP